MFTALTELWRQKDNGSVVISSYAEKRRWHRHCFRRLNIGQGIRYLLCDLKLWLIEYYLSEKKNKNKKENINRKTKEKKKKTNTINKNKFCLSRKNNTYDIYIIRAYYWSTHESSTLFSVRAFSLTAYVLRC